MNKLSTLIILSLVAFAASYDFTVGLSDQHFTPINATVTLLTKNSVNTGETATYSWKSNLVPNSNQTVNTGGIVGRKVEEFTRFSFKFVITDNPLALAQIRLRDLYLVPKYLQDPATVAKQTIRICPPEKHQLIDSKSYVELSRNNC